jgi:glyoxylase-like metal-dependent hydrolase (beta-lactamase superfamily II)
MKIIPLAIPTPFYIGDVNVYLIKEDPLTLVDTGPKTPEAIKALREGLARNGVALSDIQRIVLTHAHEDHCGLAKTIRDEAKNAEILVHGWETGHLFGRLSQDEHRNLIARAGVPAEVWRQMQGFYASFETLTDALEDNEYSALRDEAELEFASGVLKVLHTPGHTPGSCSLVREANRTLICGDCVLKRITPNPVLSPDPIDRSKRFPSLAEYLVSLARIRAAAPTFIYGGHGEPITDYEEIFNRYVRSIDERQARVINLLDSKNGGGGTAFEVAQKLFPDVIDVDTQRFLAISETIAHLDYAESQGRIAVELKEGVEYYRQN